MFETICNKTALRTGNDMYREQPREDTTNKKVIIMLQGKAEAYAQHFTLCADLAVRQREDEKDRVTGRVRWRERKLEGDKLCGCSYTMQDSSVSLNKSASPDFQTGLPDCPIRVSMCPKPTL